MELYDRGNVILADHEYRIIILLRKRRDGQPSRAASPQRETTAPPPPAPAAQTAASDPAITAVGQLYPLASVRQFSDVESSLEPANFSALLSRLCAEALQKNAAANAAAGTGAGESDPRGQTRRQGKGKHKGEAANALPRVLDALVPHMRTHCTRAVPTRSATTPFYLQISLFLSCDSLPSHVRCVPRALFSIRPRADGELPPGRRPEGRPAARSGGRRHGPPSGRNASGARDVLEAARIGHTAGVHRVQRQEERRCERSRQPDDEQVMNSSVYNAYFV